MKQRFEGTFVLAPSGAGKTTTLLYLMMNDLRFVAEGKASLIAMDSTGIFLDNLRALTCFHPDKGTLKDKLIIIEPDLVHPIALNPFSVSRQRMKAFQDPNEREEYANAAISIIAHIFSTIGAPFTERQGILFRQLVRLCLEIPNASIDTLNTIISTRDASSYQTYIDRLPPRSRDFFNQQFKTRHFQEACGDLVWRTAGVLENETLSAMLNAPTSLDLYKELNEGKVILINTSRKRIHDRSPILGRVLIAMVRLAMRERDTMPEEKRLPTYFYIDEVHEFLDNDTQVADMIDDVRKSRLGLTFATQRLSKLTDPNVKDALLSCAILLAAPNEHDAPTLAKYMNTHPEVFQFLGHRRFMMRVRGVSEAEIKTIPEFKMTRFPQISPKDQERMQQLIWQKYARQANQLTPYTRTAPVREVQETIVDVEWEEIEPSKKL